MKEKITPQEALFMIKNLAERLSKGTLTTNEIEEGEDFYISYNPDTDTGEETALCFGKEHRTFLILKGDYRDQYNTALSLEENIKVFEDLVKKGAEVSPWSN